MALVVPQVINASNGVTYGPSASAFSIETNESAQQVKLRIYKAGLGGKPVKTIIEDIVAGLPATIDAIREDLR